MTELEVNGPETTGEQELKEDSMYSETEKRKGSSKGPKIQVQDATKPDSSHLNDDLRTTKNHATFDLLNEESLEHSRTGGDPLGTVSQYAHTSRLNPLRLAANLPKPRFKLTLDNEERDLVLKHKNLNKDQIWQMLEKKRFQELKNCAINLQSDMMCNIRCPKCTLQPPCQHYKSEAALVQDAPRIAHTSSFKDAVPAQKRENLMRIIKQQSKEIAYQRAQQREYEDEMGESPDGSPVRGGSTEPGVIRNKLLLPEKDYMFDSSMKYRRRTLAENNAETPKPVHREFLKRGGGNGGSPTQFDTGLKDNRTLVPIMRQVKQPVMRIRGLHGYDSIDEGRQGSAGNERSLSPGQKQEIERKKRIQQQIAEYREMKMRQERERINHKDKEIIDAAEKIKKAESDRRKFMDQYKTKLREENSVLKASVMEESKMTTVKASYITNPRSVLDNTPIKRRNIQPINMQTVNSKQKVNPVSHSHMAKKQASPKPTANAQSKQKMDAQLKLRDFQAKKAKAEEMLLVGGGGSTNQSILPKPVEPPVQAGSNFLPMDSDQEQYTQENEDEPSDEQLQRGSPSGDRYGGSAEENYTIDESEPQTKPNSASKQPPAITSSQEEAEDNQPNYTDDYENDDD